MSGEGRALVLQQLGEEEELVVYRAVLGVEPSLDWFRSHRELGIAPRLNSLWITRLGISTYLKRSRARSTGKLLRRFGRADRVAELRLRSGDMPGEDIWLHEDGEHVNVWADPAILLVCVVHVSDQLGTPSTGG